VISWFDKEIKALPDAIVKANKNFLVYYLIRVLKMPQGHAQCRHLDGLDVIISSCDASILYEIPNDKAKLTSHIVKRWWTSHGLPYMTSTFRVEPEVGISIMCCSVWELLILTFVSLFRYRRSVLAEMVRGL
jgi:hypothetical protein